MTPGKFENSLRLAGPAPSMVLIVASMGRHEPAVRRGGAVAALTRYGRGVGSVFDLLGQLEVDLTAALGWTLYASPAFLRQVSRLLGVNISHAEADVALETVGTEGRTDVEVTTATTKVIFEAKQGWLVPGEQQLSLYANRFEGFGQAVLVSLSDSSPLWAREQLPETVAGVPVTHLSWDDIRQAASRAATFTRGRERYWIEELETYMGTATSRRPLDDQWVYCVVVSDTVLGAQTFREYVLDERVYFHPYGGHNTWPKRPPNFLCFRWGGRVRQVNRVKSFEVIPHLSDRWPGVPRGESGGPHIVYELGPDIPTPAVSTKGTYATGRVWCLLDQLLTQPTLKDAVRSSDAIAKGDS